MTTSSPAIFKDGTMYCDCGREAEKGLFWYWHKDNKTLCCFPQPTLAEISQKVFQSTSGV